MFSSISTAIATILQIAASILWGTVAGIAGTNLGIVVLALLAIAAVIILFRVGAAILRPSKDGPT